MRHAFSRTNNIQRTAWLASPGSTPGSGIRSTRCLLDSSHPHICPTKLRSNEPLQLAEEVAEAEDNSGGEQDAASPVRNSRETRARCCAPRILCRCARGSHVFLLLRWEEGVRGVRGAERGECHTGGSPQRGQGRVKMPLGTR